MSTECLVSCICQSLITKSCCCEPILLFSSLSVLKKLLASSEILIRNTNRGQATSHNMQANGGTMPGNKSPARVQCQGHWPLHWGHAVPLLPNASTKTQRVLFEKRPALYFVIIYLLLPIKCIIFYSVSKILFNIFIVSNNYYDSNNKNVAP